MYYTYMIRCEDNSVYTGITNNLERRMNEHFTQDKKCAKYTKRHKATKLEQYFITDNRKNASKLEYHIKTLSHKEKESLIMNPTLLDKLLGEKIDSSLYKFSIK